MLAVNGRTPKQQSGRNEVRWLHEQKHNQTDPLAFQPQMIKRNHDWQAMKQNKILIKSLRMKVEEPVCLGVTGLCVCQRNSSHGKCVSAKKNVNVKVFLCCSQEQEEQSGYQNKRLKYEYIMKIIMNWPSEKKKTWLFFSSFVDHAALTTPTLTFHNQL